MPNLVPPPYRVWICRTGENHTTGLEVTAACSGDSGGFFAAADPPLNNGGIAKTTGQLVLAPIPEIAVEWNPWRNPARWQIGNRVVIHVQGESGGWGTHPKSELYIVSDPEPPTPSNPFLTLELGDRLVLLDYQQQDEDASGVTPGKSKTQGEILSNILSKLRISIGQSSVNSLGRSVDYPMPKTGGSYLQQAGSICHSNGAFLYGQDGNVELRYLNLSPAWRLFKFSVERDSAEYSLLQNAGEFNGGNATANPATSPLGDRNWGNRGNKGSGNFRPESSSDRPPNKVKVVGVGKETRPVVKSGSNSSEEWLPGEAIHPGSGNGERIAVRSKESWHWAGTLYRRTVSTFKARGLVVPQDFFEELGLKSLTSPFALIKAEETKETKHYEGGEQGRLLKQEIHTYRTIGEELQEYYRNNPPTSAPNLLGTVLAEHEVTTYDYDSGTQPRKIKRSKWLVRGKIAANANDWTTKIGLSPLTLVPYEKLTTTWEQINTNEYIKREVIRRAGRVARGGVGAFCALGTVSDTTEHARNGSTQPPAAEVRQPDIDVREKLFKAESTFQAPDGSDLADRELLIEVDNLTSDDDARQIAERAGQIYKARHQGFRFVDRFRDEWFHYRPLSRIDLEWDGRIYLGVTNAVAFTLGADRAEVAANCMKIGDLGPVDTYPPNPPTNPAAVTQQPYTPSIRVVATPGGSLLLTGAAHPQEARPTNPLATLNSTLLLNSNAGFPFPGSLLLTGQPYAQTSGAGRLLISVSNRTPTNEQIVHVYFDATLPPMDIQRHPRIDIPAADTLDLSPILHRYGAGYYILTASDPTTVWAHANMFNLQSTSGATLTDSYHQDIRHFFHELTAAKRLYVPNPTDTITFNWSFTL